VQAILSRYDHCEGRLFDLNRDHIGSLLRAALKRSELKCEHFSAHDLRRTFSTWLGEHQYPREVNDRCLNHSRRDIHSIYNRARLTQPAGEAWAAWSRYLEGLESNVITTLTAHQSRSQA
jgi:integrase